MVELERRRAHLGVAGPIFAVDQENVGIAVVVIIDEGATRAQGLRQVFLPERGIVVDEANAGLGSDIAEGDGLRVCWVDEQQNRSLG